MTSVATAKSSPASSPVNPFATRYTASGARDYLSKQKSQVKRDDLSDALNRHGSVAIVGPHGTGKTTLVKWWWRDCDREVRWVSLSSGQVVEPRARSNSDLRGLVAPSTTAGPKVSTAGPKVSKVQAMHASRDSMPVNSIVKEWVRRGAARLANFKTGIGLCYDSVQARQAAWVVDGWEQLPAVIGWLLRSTLKRRGVGLVVTSHRDHAGISTIHRTGIDDDIVRELVDDLFAGVVHDSDPADHVRRHVDARLANQNVDDVRELLFELYDVYSESVRSAS